MREVHHELTLQLLPPAHAASSGCLLAAARLSPEVPHVKAFLDAAIDGSDISPAYIVRLSAYASALKLLFLGLLGSANLAAIPISLWPWLT